MLKSQIRLATKDDRECWAQLRAELWPDCPLHRHELEVSQLLNSSGIVVLAETEGDIVGFAEVSVRVDHVEGTSSAPVPYLEGWYVAPAARGKGVGRALIAFVESWARGQGFVELASDAEIQNYESIRLHGLLGFSETGRTVHFVKRLAAE